MFKCIKTCLLLLLFVPLNLSAKSLPEPLTLKAALALAKASSQPELERVRAAIKSTRADEMAADAKQGLNLNLNSGIRFIEPSITAGDQHNNDSYVRFSVSKELYDFGRNRADKAVLASKIKGINYRLMSARQRRHLAVMKGFFAVLEADLAFSHHNEEMATSYIRFDRAKNKMELKKLSEIEVLKLEAEYQGVRRKRALSENRQRLTRESLAIIMNRPGELSSDLKTPDMKRWKRPVPDLDQLIAQMLSGNLNLKALMAEVEEQKKRMAAADTQNYPKISAELSSAAYMRQSGGYHPLAAELKLEIPLYQGGKKKAAKAKARAAMLDKSAELKGLELELRQRVTNLWMKLQELQLTIDELKVKRNYRELKLDRNRALYEMEVKADLGDSMVDISAQRLEEARLTFDRALIWTELEMLTGKLH